MTGTAEAGAGGPGGARAIHRTLPELEAGLAEVRRSPPDDGVLQLIVCRPAINERLILDEGALDVDDGLVGDNWRQRGDRDTVDGEADADKQVNIMNARAAALVAGSRERWALAGDQLYVDFDLSPDNLPLGSRLAIGSAIVEITAEPHVGCAKFAARFGMAAARLANSAQGAEVNLRGVCARVVVAGAIRRGDRVRKVPVSPPSASLEGSVLP